MYMGGRAPCRGVFCNSAIKGAEKDQEMAVQAFCSKMGLELLGPRFLPKPDRLKRFLFTGTYLVLRHGA